MIHLSEQRENNKSVDMPFGVDTRKVDVNSTVQIHVTPMPVSPGATLPTPLLTQIAEEFRASAAAMPQALELAFRLATPPPPGPELENRQNALKQVNTAYAKFGKNALRYIDTLRSSGDQQLAAHGAKFNEDLNSAILEAGPTPEDRGRKLQTLLTAEAKFLEEKLLAQAQSLAVEPATRALVLAAEGGGKDNYLPLPNYNNIPSGQPITYDKLNPIRSPEDLAALQSTFKEAQQVAQLANDIKAGKTNVRDAAEKVLSDSGINIPTLAQQFRTVQSDIAGITPKDVNDAAAAVRGAVEKALSSKPSPGDSTQLNLVREDLTKVETDAVALKDAYGLLSQQVQKLSPRFSRPDLQQGADPVAALATILDDVNTARSLVNSGVTDLQLLATQLRTTLLSLVSLSNDVTTLTNAIKAVPTQALVADIANALGNLKSVQKLTDDAKTLNESLEKALATIEQLRTQFSNPDLAAYDPNPPASSIIVTMNNLKDTWLNLPEAFPNRKEGDIVTLHAWIYEVTKNGADAYSLSKVLESQIQQFRITRFGVFLDASAGVTYVWSDVKPQAGGDKTKQFAPQVSALAHLRPWPTTGEAANVSDPWYTSWGIGFHVISFDLNRDNQLELGLGMTISAWNGVLQLGIGREITLQKGNYWFLGTSLFRFLTNSGVKAP
jgi:hypothetical protein